MKDQFHEIFKSKGINYFTQDQPMREFLNFFKFEGDSDIEELGKYVSEELIEIMDFVDHNGKPELITWNPDGKRIDYVRLSPEHKKALKRLQDFGVVIKSASGNVPWMYHFVSGYLISDSGIFCSLTLTAQTAYALKKYYKGDEKFLEHFLDGSDPWYGATFYSETQGGSDLGANKTRATETKNGWVLNGSDKYFASNAGIADGAVVIAMAGDKGIRSLVTFFMPAARKSGEPNFTIRRLKNKLGTVAVPTGEVEFSDSEAYLLGERNKGIYYAMEILTISRVDDAMAAVGIARKAFWEAYLFAERRATFGKTINSHPLMRKDITSLEAELEGAIILSLYAAKLFSDVVEVEPPYNDSYHYARFITHLSKNIAAWSSVHVTQYSMEIFGGIGFFEEFPIAKFHRDALVTSIWEGTSNIQALEMMETIAKKGVATVFFDDLKRRMERVKDTFLKEKLETRIKFAEEQFESLVKSGSFERGSKDLLKIFGNVLSLALLSEAGSELGSQRLIGISEIYDIISFENNRIGFEDLFENMELVNWMHKV
ncbi:MAG: acyl-CoA dehydrogenase family protein [Candidatus Thermoplasmatota archaeon]|nr:acyl-CoA dehydrogenase family protein [Candidatus Thermoplasmatota archaeon]MCL5888394.1 acyl-CoA dehydrogenase family protein [Candidatus Thermoplasmatota archaeon]